MNHTERKRDSEDPFDYDDDCLFFMGFITRDGSRAFSGVATCQNVTECRGCRERRKRWAMKRAREDFAEPVFFQRLPDSDEERERLKTLARRERRRGVSIEWVRVANGATATYLSSMPVSDGAIVLRPEAGVKVLGALLSHPAVLSWTDSWRPPRQQPWTYNVGATREEDVMEDGLARGAKRIAASTGGQVSRDERGSFLLPAGLDPLDKHKILKEEVARASVTPRKRRVGT